MSIPGNKYAASFTGISVSAVQDVIEITAPSDALLLVYFAFLGQYSDAGDSEAELLPVNWTRYASSGSGGGSATVTPYTIGNTSGATVERNNTTQGGTPTVLESYTFHVQAGWYFQPTPEEYIPIDPSGILALELPVAPADALTMACTVKFIEVGNS